MWRISYENFCLQIHEKWTSASSFGRKLREITDVGGGGCMYVCKSVQIRPTRAIGPLLFQDLGTRQDSVNIARLHVVGVSSC